MSQNDFNIANQGFPATRADINSALQALASTSAGATAPSTTYAYQMWYDETDDLLKMRNGDNDAWITLAAFDQTADEWELRSAVIQAVDSAGVVIKTDDGTTRVTVADNGNVTLANDLVVTGTVQASNISATGSMAARNKIINGAMVIDQRNAGAAVTVNNGGDFFPVDRFQGTGASSDGVFTLQQDASAPAGFVNSMKLTVTTADASIGAGQRYVIRHVIEGYNVADLSFGTAGAKTITVSFWVRSSLTGTFGGSVLNSAQNRAYPFSYSISSADTWEYKTVTITGDTTGTWLVTNGVGLTLGFDVGCGSTLKGTAGAWTAGPKWGVTGGVDLIATSGATFYITGVQLEAGDTATPFEHRNIGQELALCQRYFISSFPDGTAVANGVSGAGLEGAAAAFTTSDVYCSPIIYPTPMRANPTLTFFNNANTSGVSGQWATYDNAWTAVTSTVSATGTNKYFTPYLARSGAFTRLNSYLFSGHYSASAEL